MKVKEKLYFACLSTAGWLVNIKHAGLNIGDEVTTVNELDKMIQTEGNELHCRVQGRANGLRHAV